jgi:hypothetical protein
MPIYEQLMGVLDASGHVVLMCRVCKTPAKDANTPKTILKVCSQCGMPLGEWGSKPQRNAELRKWAQRVKQAARL